MGRHNEAEQMFYLARQLKDHCPLCYYNMGNSLFSRQLYDRAIWCWEQTRNLDPNHPQIEYRIGQAFWAQGNALMGKEHFLAELRSNPGDLDVLIDIGILLLEINELESAREKFHRILELDHNQPQAHHYLGELHQHGGELALAVERFNKALALNPRQNGSHFRLGQCFLQLGQIANAREHFLQELKLSPEEPEVLLELGCLLEQVEATCEAMNCFERLIGMSPENPQGYHNLSLCYYHKGLIDQGIDLSLRVLELQPHHVLALHNLAFAYLQNGEYEKADQYIQMAADVAGDDRQIQKLKRAITLRKICSRITHTPRQTLKRMKNRLSQGSKA